MRVYQPVGSLRKVSSALLVTSGTFAVRTMGILAACLCLLLLFYTVESLERERSTRLAAIAYATPIRTGSLFLGKGMAMVVVGLAIIAGGGVGRRDRPPDPAEGRPGAAAVPLVWGLLLMPTVLVWTALVMAVHTVTQNRYTTYALCLAVLCFTGYRALTNQINWVWQLAAMARGALERYQRARARPHGHGLEPGFGRRPGGLPGRADAGALSPPRVGPDPRLSTG